MRSITDNKKFTLSSQSILLGMLFVISALALNAYANLANAAAPKTEANKSMKTEAAAELTPEFIYKYLIAEIAGQRGDFATSGSVFYDLAQTTQDPRLAERAAKTAAYGKVSNLAIPSVRLWAELDPENYEAQQAMTEMLIAIGKLKEAEPFLTKLLAKEETRDGGFLYLNTLLCRSVDK